VALLGADAGYRLSAGLAFVYTFASMLMLQRRVARVGIRWGRSWAGSAIALTLVGATLSALIVALPSPGLYELLVVVMLARPMAIFLLVLATIDEPGLAPSTNRP
jgi:hypothetical protein